MPTHDEIVAEVLDLHPESEVHDMVAEVIHEYLDDDWEDEFDDEFEAYEEQGRGEAEDSVLQSIIQPITDKHGCSLDEYCAILDQVKEEWSL